MRKYLIFCVSFFIVFLASAQVIRAQSFEKFELVVGDGLAYEDNIIPSVVSGDQIEFSIRSGSCYCCQLWTRDNIEENPHFTDLVLARDTTGGSGVNDIGVLASGTLSPGMPGLRRLSRQKSRVCFSVSSDEGELSDAILTMGFGENSTAAATNVKVKCEETTLFGGYNTSVTDYNFLELRNTHVTGPSIEANISIRDNSSNSFRQFNISDINIGPFGRVDLSVHDTVGPGSYGNIAICSDAPKGALKAQLVQYKIDNNDPTSFTPVSREVFKTRDEE